MTDVTQILQQIETGDPSASERLLPLVYDELRKLAAAKMASERPDHTLQATALVHEAYVRLVHNAKSSQWDSRSHFFSAAAESMRRILIEQARKHDRREGIQGQRVSLDDLSCATSFPSELLLQLDERLEMLEARDQAIASLVKLRFYAGLTMAQAAEALNVPIRTAERKWTYARTWLHRELERCAAEEKVTQFE
ncbi:MAG: sigma-70 family RNA polymerase sigma factor [Planctomycetaceae bacterium]|nr:sigma-70 family RNA polymerase sigma factor [Planctomycetaceae bacterium]